MPENRRLTRPARDDVQDALPDVTVELAASGFDLRRTRRVGLCDDLGGLLDADARSAGQTDVLVTEGEPTPFMAYSFGDDEQTGSADRVIGLRDTAGALPCEPEPDEADPIVAMLNGWLDTLDTLDTGAAGWEVIPWAEAAYWLDLTPADLKRAVRDAGMKPENMKKNAPRRSGDPAVLGLLRAHVVQRLADLGASAER